MADKKFIPGKGIVSGGKATPAPGAKKEAIPPKKGGAAAKKAVPPKKK